MIPRTTCGCIFSESNTIFNWIQFVIVIAKDIYKLDNNALETTDIVFYLFLTLKFPERNQQIALFSFK